jgi:hypothetical protein
MRKFMIKLARIEKATGGRSEPQVCITFRIQRGAVSFQVPIHLRISDYDDT